MQKNTYIAIMAGGVGSRFWPESREEMPKQFLDILGVGKSLIRLTYERFLKLVPSENIYIVTNKQYRGLVKEHLPELSDNQILGEPSRNNTAPCVAYAAFKLQALDPEANMVVAPSDHVILKEDIFIEKIQEALAFTAKENALLTLGIAPTRPDTGYGYIKYEDTAAQGEIFPVKEFKEKPNLITAQSYLQEGNYVWNAGIFIWKVANVLAAFKDNAPEIHEILGAGKNIYNTAQEQSWLDKHYPTCPDISVDYAIMEKAKNIYTLPADFGWSDLGTWASLHAYLPKDDQENVLQLSGIAEVSNSIIRIPSKKKAIVKGLDNYIVVDTPHALLIYPKDEEQGIKEKVKKILG